MDVVVEGFKGCESCKVKNKPISSQQNKFQPNERLLFKVEWRH